MVKIIFGGASLSDAGDFNTPALRSQVTSILLSNNITNIDSARLYPGSEVAIGQLSNRTSFTIDTKWMGGVNPGHLDTSTMLSEAKDSLANVGIPKFDIFYIHVPDKMSPLEDSLAGMNAAYKSGIFARFGLSNFTAAGVQEVHDMCKDKGYPLPTVYQGNYSAVARGYEETLFPTLRQLDIAFYAYSPLAGGFLTKTAEELDAGVNRFSPQAMFGLYASMYDKPSMRVALLKWSEIAEREGVGRAELAYRWVRYHSALKGEEDGVVFGARTVEQVEETAKTLQKGPLSEEAVRGIEEVWESVKGDAPVHNFMAFV